MTEVETGADDAGWADAALVASLIAIDPVGLRGACIRGPHGAARDRWLALLRAVLPAEASLRRVPLHISEDRLLGGLDLTATLRAGKPIAQRGLLAESDGGLVLLAMAERIAPATVAQINAVLDSGERVLERNGIALRTPIRIGVIAFDEGIDDDERVPAELLDRLPFLLDFTGLRVPGEPSDFIDADMIADARARLPTVSADDQICEALCVTAMQLGIASIRASIMVLRAARALAALDGRSVATQDDAAAAARLVLAPRATQLPQAQNSEDSADEQGSDESEQQQDGSNDEVEDQDQPDRSDTPPQDLIVAAAAAAIPKGLLERLRADRSLASRARSNGRAGALRQSLLRGRPAGVRRGEPRAGVRLNLIETLRAAAPWQPLRRQSVGDRGARRIEIRSEDFHVTRYKQRTQTTTIFVVDASGSSALSRLAEAKGAVELLLADCYVRRDQVAVIAFRGSGAELLLPPTRSLVRAKRSLAGLPGGGGTPLATAIDAGVALSEQVRRAGHSAALVLLTDGRANVARDGSGGRERAESDAAVAAKRAGASAISSLFIDISPRPQPQAERLAALMNARYVALPHADAATLSNAVKTVTMSARR